MEMASINDWAAKAASHIDAEIRLPSRGSGVAYKPTRERIAAIIATFAEPLTALLRDSRREHFHYENAGSYQERDCCPQCTCESWDAVARSQDAGHLDAEREPNSDEPCTCGADAWNARVNAAIEG